MTDQAVVEQCSDGQLLMYCPGCKLAHGIYPKSVAGSGPRWEFDGNYERPTFSPSLLVRWNYGSDKVERRCHSFIKSGQWQFLSDCTHELAGQTVDMVTPD